MPNKRAEAWKRQLCNKSQRYLFARSKWNRLFCSRRRRLVFSQLFMNYYTILEKRFASYCRAPLLVRKSVILWENKIMFLKCWLSCRVREMFRRIISTEDRPVGYIAIKLFRWSLVYNQNITSDNRPLTRLTERYVWCLEISRNERSYNCYLKHE